MSFNLSPKSGGKFLKEKVSVGLDIGTQMVKIVKLRISQDGAELLGFELAPAQVELVEVLKKIKQSQNITQPVNIAVSGPATVIRAVPFARMNNAELHQALKFETQKHIPFSLGEVNIGGCILKEDLPDNKMLVLVAAVKKEFINQRLKFVEGAGLKVGIVDIDSLALVNAFHFNYGPDENLNHKGIALLNIGAAITNLSILEDGILRLSRDIQVAGNNFTQKIADMVGMDFKSAERLKLSSESADVNRIQTALESVFSNLATEIRTSFDYFESQGASSVGKIFLSGGSSLLPGLKERLVSLLGIEIDYWDPLKKITLAATVDAQAAKASSAQLAVALGLALR